MGEGGGGGGGGRETKTEKQMRTNPDRSSEEIVESYTGLSKLEVFSYSGNEYPRGNTFTLLDDNLCG